jgi:hypothetical protein
MRSLKVLLFGVVLPGALSAGLYAAITNDHRHEVHVVRAVEVDVHDVAEAVEVAVAAELGAHQERCEHARSQEARLDAGDLERLSVEAGSGSLRVVGRADLDEVVVRSMMCASSERLLEQLVSTLTREGGEAVVDTDYPRSSGFGNRYARIDLEIDVPLGMDADIIDASGALYVGGTGDTEVTDGSGEIEAQGVSGSLTVRDGSGEIRVADIGGDVEIIDGSGEIHLTTVGGDVSLTDGSGPIEISEVSGSVHVRADGSGSIEVADVGGDFRVGADGSGSITHSGVKGKVDIPRKGGR